MMFKKQYDEIEVASKEISFSGNETIVENINRVIAYIQEHKVLATKEKHYFAIKHIKDLNTILVDPIDVFSTRPAQKTYPNINGIYLLLRTMGMLTFQVSKKETVMGINSELLESWQRLNSVEQNSFTFIFDFGDWWEFDIFIEKIEEGKRMDDFKLIKSVGEAPKQYPDYDEEW